MTAVLWLGVSGDGGHAFLILLGGRVGRAAVLWWSMETNAHVVQLYSMAEPGVSMITEEQSSCHVKLCSIALLELKGSA